MKQGARTLPLLLLLALGLGALLWWDRKRPSTDEAREAASRLLPGFRREQARALTVSRGGVTTRLERAAGGEWRLAGSSAVGPRADAATAGSGAVGPRADAEAVDALLGVLEYGQLERRVRAPERAKLGLESPRIVLTVEGAHPATLRLGADDPSGRWVYVERDGEPTVLVVEHRLLEVTDLPPERLRSLRLVATAPEALSSLELGALRLAHGPNPDDAWQVGPPAQAVRADDHQVDALLGALEKARAARVLDGSAPAGGDPLRVNGAVEARLLGPCPGHAGEREVAEADGSRLCFPESQLAPLLAPPEPLRDRRPFALEVDQVSTVHVELDGRSLELRRQAGLWRITLPRERAGLAEDALVRPWLTGLLRAQASGFGAPGPARGTIELSSGTTGAVERATLGGSPATLGARGPVTLGARGPAALGARGPVTLTRAGEHQALLLDERLAELLEPDPERFRDRRVLYLRPDELARIRLDGEDAPDLRDPVLALTAARYEPDATVEPAHRLELATARGAYTLAISPARSDGCLAQLTGPDAPPVPFRLRTATCRRLEFRVLP